MVTILKSPPRHAKKGIIQELVLAVIGVVVGILIILAVAPDINQGFATASADPNASAAASSIYDLGSLIYAAASIIFLAGAIVIFRLKKNGTSF